MGRMMNMYAVVRSLPLAGRLQFIQDLLVGVPDAETGELIPLISREQALALYDMDAARAWNDEQVRRCAAGEEPLSPVADR